MGVPSFFKWLVTTFPSIIKDCKGASCAENKMDQPNQNGVEFDNFYIDLNGVIHQCANPQDRKKPRSINEMMLMLTRYIDYLIDIVRPRKLLYIAVDGVAPRAKMNQQRSRRFLSVQNEQKAEQKVEQKGENFDFDSNCITPGTEFMNYVSCALRKYIQIKIKTYDYWKKIKVILSDCNVPGEGEHKIVDFIRRQKDSPNYEPNLRHCIYGLDADLIMLSLATHEPIFTIVREKLVMSKWEECFICGKKGHYVEDCPLKEKQEVDAPIKKPAQFLFIYVLRQYLKQELNVNDKDFERMLDDYVFILYLCGNDFLPHMESLQIRNDAAAELLNVYKDFIKENDYISNSGKLNSEVLINFLNFVSKNEPRYLKEKAKKERDLELRYLKSSKELTEEEIQAKIKEYDDKDFLKYETDGYQERYYKAFFDIDYPKEGEQSEELKYIVLKYYEGLNWVLEYYYQGCPGWEWYYPFYYAPLLQDITKYVTKDYVVHFNLGKPFRPIEQLMAVLPPQSCSCVPDECKKLMLYEDSPIFDFYPGKVEIDMRGKKFKYQGIAKVPFVDEKRLIEAIEPLEKNFTEEEKQRNHRFGDDLLFVSRNDSSIKNSCFELFSKCKRDWEEIYNSLNEKYIEDEYITIPMFKDCVANLTYEKDGIAGTLLPSFDIKYDIQDSIYVFSFRNPSFEKGHTFEAHYSSDAKPPVYDVLELPKSMKEGKVRSFEQPNNHKSNSFNNKYTSFDNAYYKSYNNYNNNNRYMYYGGGSYNNRGGYNYYPDYINYNNYNNYYNHNNYYNKGPKYYNDNQKNDNRRGRNHSKSIPYYEQGQKSSQSNPIPRESVEKKEEKKEEIVEKKEEKKEEIVEKKEEKKEETVEKKEVVEKKEEKKEEKVEKKEEIVEKKEEKKEEIVEKKEEKVEKKEEKKKEKVTNNRPIFGKGAGKGYGRRHGSN